MEELKRYTQKTNKDAITSFILGVISLTIPYIGLITSVLGILIAKKSIENIRRTKAPGYGLAISGLVCNGLAFTIYFIAIILLGYIWHVLY